MSDRVSRKKPVFAASVHQRHLSLNPLTFLSRRCGFLAAYSLAGKGGLGTGVSQILPEKGAGLKRSMGGGKVKAFHLLQENSLQETANVVRLWINRFSLLWMMWTLIFIAVGCNRLTLRIEIRRFLKSNMKCFTYGLINWSVDSVKAPDPKAVICSDKQSKVIYCWQRLARTYIAHGLSLLQ